VKRGDGPLLLVVLALLASAACPTTGNYRVDRAAWQAVASPPERGPTLAGASARRSGPVTVWIRPVGDGTFQVDPAQGSATTSSLLMRDPGRDDPSAAGGDGAEAIDRVASAYVRRSVLVPALDGEARRPVYLFPEALGGTPPVGREAWVPAETSTRNGLVTGGIIAVGSGAAVAGLGALLLVPSAQCVARAGSSAQGLVDSVFCWAGEVIGIVVAGLGGAAVLTGITLASVGAGRHPERAREGQDDDRARLPPSSAEPVPPPTAPQAGPVAPLPSALIVPYTLAF
jgi:hypothetical protein